MTAKTPITPNAVSETSRKTTAKDIETASLQVAGGEFGIMIEGVFTPTPYLEVGFMGEGGFIMTGYMEGGVFTPSGFMKNGEFIPGRSGTATKGVQCSSSTKRRIAAHPDQVIDLTMDDSPVKKKKVKLHNFRRGDPKGKGKAIEPGSDCEVIEILSE